MCHDHNCNTLQASIEWEHAYGTKYHSSSTQDRMHAAITSRMREIYSDMTEDPTPSVCLPEYNVHQSMLTEQGAACPCQPKLA